MNFQSGIARASIEKVRGLHARTTSAAATAALAAIATCSALLYWLGFVRSYPLLKLYEQPLLNMYDHVTYSHGAYPSWTPWLLVSAFLGQGALYWLGWRASQRAHGRLAWAIVLAGAALFSGLLLFMYPFDAADVFDNIMHARILGKYGGNPFLHVARQFPDDPFVPYVAWKRSVSAYGPGWELLAGWTAHSVGDGILGNVLAFKLLAGAFLAASAGVVALILRRMAPERALAGVVLLTWNPVIIYETFGNGHNDMAMVFWVLLAIMAVLWRRYTLAILALVVGALFKYIPLLMLPAAGLIALRELPDGRTRLRFVLLTGWASLLLVWLAYFPFWQGPDMLTIERRTQMFTTSVPAAIVAALQPFVGQFDARRGVALVAAAATVGFALWQGAHAWRDRTWLAFPQAAFNIVMFYLLLTCLWFQQWYAVWPLGLAALLPPGHAARLAALFGYVAISKQLIFEPLYMTANPLPPKAWRELRLGPSVLAIAWLYVALAWWDRRRASRRELRTQGAPATGNPDSAQFAASSSRLGTHHADL